MSTLSTSEWETRGVTAPGGDAQGGSAHVTDVPSPPQVSDRMQALLSLQSPQFSILSGDDPTCSRAMLAGADGVISVAANAAPRQLRALCDASRARDAERAQRIDADLAALYELLGVEPNPIPVKWCLQLLGFGSADPRLPLLPLSPAFRENAARVMAALPDYEPMRQSDAA